MQVWNENDTWLFKKVHTARVDANDSDQWRSMMFPIIGIPGR